ncbi:MAG: 4-hydroxythreonine-4-phosphate dehydrogenase PdxA [Phycisphaerales bacterium]|nr:4-hydroxythreonine-4-phosphate dehydrogenase PdxA [Phycisphaerales bacterium]
MGDPGSIGPEIVLKALQRVQASGADIRYQVYCHRATMLAVASELGFDNLLHDDRIELIEPAGVESLGDLALADMRKPNKRGGYISMRCVETAIDACLKKDDAPSGVVTAPISKTAWHMAGFESHPGHTELLAEKCNAHDVRMGFVSPKLRVVLETIHVPLRDVPDMLRTDHIVRTIERAAQLCIDLGISSPRVAVAGLNPHAGEDGMMGAEDIAMIAPAVKQARESGIDASGPHPGDTVFGRAFNGGFDVVVAMYHDQGLIPVKLLGWENAVNVTLGLPIVRTSPDHGTAFDIAGRGKANESSMLAAIDLAIQLAHVKG